MSSYPSIPIPLSAPRDPSERGCVVLVDGEHYPAAVADAIIDLQSVGWSVNAVALVGGGEKLRETPEYGVPHFTAPSSVADLNARPLAALKTALEHAQTHSAPSSTPTASQSHVSVHTPKVSAVIDLADEPVLVFERRLELIGFVASQGLRYLMADTAIEPPVFSAVEAPTLSIIGTGKRIGKTAVSAHAARTIDQYLGNEGNVVVVAMGRGGPAQPIVVDRNAGKITVERLLEISRGGEHAASDYLEGAVLTGLTTIGCRRVSGGLLGVPARSNVLDGAKLAAALSSELILLEGSGSCIPPVKADATLLIASTARPQDVLSGLGPYRLNSADLVLVMGDDRETAAEICAAAQKLTGKEPATFVGVSLVPTPVSSVENKRVAAFTTAPEFVAPIVTRELTNLGAEVVLVSCALANRDQLTKDLERAFAQGVDALVVEIKAAAIDAVAEAADRAGVDVIFLDNVPRPHDSSINLDDLLRGLADQALQRYRDRE